MEATKRQGFQNREEVGDRSRHILTQTKAAHDSWLRHKPRSRSVPKTMEMMACEAPPIGVVKINTDGARREDGHTTTACVIRNNTREWYMDFVLGICSVPMVEL